MKKDDIGGKQKRGSSVFRILIRNNVTMNEDIVIADRVVDCSGVWGNPNWSGIGGIPAVGELRLSELGRLKTKIPNLAFEGDKFLGKTSMIIGTGASAITTIKSLRDLAQGWFDAIDGSSLLTDSKSLQEILKHRLL